jgi:hypothetical protein
VFRICAGNFCATKVQFLCGGSVVSFNDQLAALAPEHPAPHREMRGEFMQHLSEHVCLLRKLEFGFKPERARCVWY